MRTHILRLRLSPVEFEKLKSKADRIGLNISAFVRFIVSNVEFELTQRNHKEPTNNLKKKHLDRI